jgi:hypothetical protein
VPPPRREAGCLICRVSFSTDANLTFETLDKHWRFALEGKNLVDKRVLKNSFNLNLASTPLGVRLTSSESTTTHALGPSPRIQVLARAGPHSKIAGCRFSFNKTPSRPTHSFPSRNSLKGMEIKLDIRPRTNKKYGVSALFHGSMDFFSSLGVLWRRASI